MKHLSIIPALALGALLALGVAGCSVGEPAADIRPEPAAAVAPAAEPAPAQPTADTAAPPGAQPEAGDGCCGSPSCQRAADQPGQGCACRRNLPPELAAQVNCGG